jgi:hypothetical protein
MWGKTGSGKTLRAVSKALKDFMFGRAIWGNMRFRLIPYHYVEIPELVQMVVRDDIDPSPKTLILDEIQTAFDGRRSGSQQNINLALFVSQCRKRGFNIIYTSQFITGADPRMRMLTDKLTRCIPTFNLNDVGLGDLENPEPIKLTYLTTDPQEPLIVKKKTLKREVFRQFYKHYNTLEIIKPEVSYAFGS